MPASKASFKSWRKTPAFRQCQTGPESQTSNGWPVGSCQNGKGRSCCDWRKLQVVEQSDSDSYYEMRSLTYRSTITKMDSSLWLFEIHPRQCSRSELTNAGISWPDDSWLWPMIASHYDVVLSDVFEWAPPILQFPSLHCAKINLRLGFPLRLCDNT